MQEKMENSGWNDLLIMIAPWGTGRHFLDLGTHPPEDIVGRLGREACKQEKTKDF